MSIINEAVSAYKYAVLAYQAVAGHTQELSIFHLKLLDVFDKIDDSQALASEELALQALSLARKIAGHTYAWISQEIGKHKDQRLDQLRLSLSAKVTQIDETPELDRCQAARMLLRATNVALQGSAAIIGVEQPDLEKLKT